MYTPVLVGKLHAIVITTVGDYIKYLVTIIISPRQSLALVVCFSSSMC